MSPFVPKLSNLTRVATLATLPILLLGACADRAPSTAPLTPPAPVDTAAVDPSPVVSSSVVSQTLVGDTTVTVFVVGNDTAAPVTFGIGNSSKIVFPYSSSSICDPGTSSYGPGEWNASCDASTSAVQITAKSWVGASGKLDSDFQPALRFVPGAKKAVTVYLKDRDLVAHRIDYCSASGCVDESVSDSSLATHYDGNNGWAYRAIKHFSGYHIVL
jgi:hypothetical protein